jgi:GPH family glycoside/pentoside/hexuronide:cation symporter
MSILHGVTGNITVIVGLAAVFTLNRLSHRIGKRPTLAICLGLLVLSSFAKWIFYQPSNPYLSLAVILFVSPAFAGFWLLISSIKADICDYEELQTGLRREGALAAISTWITKMSYSATSILSGFILVITGYEAAKGGAQPEEVVHRLRIFYYILPSATAIPALILLYFFPISEKRAQEIRLELERRRGKL